MERLNDELIGELHRNSPVCCDDEENLDQALQYQEIFSFFDRNSTGTPGYHFGGY